MNDDDVEGVIREWERGASLHLDVEKDSSLFAGSARCGRFPIVLHRDRCVERRTTALEDGMSRIDSTVERWSFIRQASRSGDRPSAVAASITRATLTRRPSIPRAKEVGEYGVTDSAST